MTHMIEWVGGNLTQRDTANSDASDLTALSPAELRCLIHQLKQHILRLEAEKIEALTQQNRLLSQEMEARTESLIQKVAREQLLSSVSQDIRASVELETVLQTAVRKVHEILHCDRVAIWKMQPDRSVITVAEALSDGCPSSLGRRVLDPCFDAPSWVQSYQQGRTRVVEDIEEARLADCHRDLLKSLHIRAKIMVPLIQDDELWGLLSVVESRGPRQWLLEEVGLLRELSVQLAIAIQQAVSYQKMQAEMAKRKRVEARVVYNSLHDPLTNLPNRSYLINRLESILTHPLQGKACQCSVLFLDLDHFKVVNDSLGHRAGDQLLEIVAQKLQLSLRSTDIAARFGGDEFAILLLGLAPAEVCNIAQRILREFRKPVQLQGCEIFVTASLGIVMDGGRYDSPTTLMRDADIALYQAKSKGRNRYAIFDEAMYAQALRRLNLERALRQALEYQQFLVYYQPIINLADDSLAGFEALVRWQHPELGFISPEEFIPLAEETGLITELTRWVLETACRQLVAWKTEFSNLSSLKISVNLSVQDLRKESLAEDIGKILQRTGLESRYLTLEITESLLIDNIDSTIELLNQLKSQGICISIDDFGTGYSSLQYLSHLPSNNLKIDRSFVSGLEQGDRNHQLVEVIIALANQLKLDAIAEGIETQQQLDWLKALGCEFAQGYFFSRPVSADEMHGLLVEKYDALPRLATGQSRSSDSLLRTEVLSQ